MHTRLLIATVLLIAAPHSLSASAVSVNLLSISNASASVNANVSVTLPSLTDIAYTAFPDESPFQECRHYFGGSASCPTPFFSFDESTLEQRLSASADTEFGGWGSWGLAIQNYTGLLQIDNTGSEGITIPVAGSLSYDISVSGWVRRGYTDLRIESDSGTILYEALYTSDSLEPLEGCVWGPCRGAVSGTVPFSFDFDVNQASSRSISVSLTTYAYAFIPEPGTAGTISAAMALGAALRLMQRKLSKSA